MAGINPANIHMAFNHWFEVCPINKIATMGMPAILKICMRKIFFLLGALVAITQPGFTQVKPPAEPKQLLHLYFNIKNALVSDDPGSASVNAQSFLDIARELDRKLIYEDYLLALIIDAHLISRTKDLEEQRSCFCNLSANMSVIANSIKLSKDAIFKQYCPLKKASWLTSERDIRNPYYGLQMADCGEVIEIIR